MSPAANAGPSERPFPVRALSNPSNSDRSRYTGRGIECKSRSGRRPTFFSGGDMDVEALLRPVVEAAGLELVDAAFARERGRRILRVTVDRDSAGGIDLDTIAEVSGRISRRLDLEDVVS